MKSPQHIGRLGLFVAALAAASSVSAQTVILSDSFNRANSGLNGQTVESWNAGFYETAPTWSAPVNAVISGGEVTGNAHVGIYSRVATPNQTEGVLTISADISFGTTNTAEWIGLGFALDTSVALTNSNNTLMVILRNNGTISLFKNGTSHTFYNQSWGAWNSVAFDPTATYNFELQYDRDAGTVNVRVDGANVRLAPSVVGTLTSASFGSVGVQILPLTGGNIVNNATVDNFLYTTSIPEPSAYAALVGGVALAGGLIRRRRRAA